MCLLSISPQALSNQKLQELQERFGASRVGLRTGDAALQTDADIIVMTTEILRNMLYDTEDERWATVREL